MAGTRLPSEAALTKTYSVSRTVVREAISVLRTEGLVESKKGSGVFVLDLPEQDKKPFADLDATRISSAIELLELRSAVEIRSAGLASVRRSAAQIERLIENHRKLKALVEEGVSTAEIDFQFHCILAEATQNKRFIEFLSVIREGIIPRASLDKTTSDRVLKGPNPYLVKEHQLILDAVMDGDQAGAEAAMTRHLDNSLARYRAALKETGNR